MSDDQVAHERHESTRTTARVSRGGSGCCGCCAGVVVLGALATIAGLSVLLGWGSNVVSGLDESQRLGLAILGLLALVVFVYSALRLRPRMTQTTRIVTRVVRPNRPEQRTSGVPGMLDADWRPTDPPEEESPHQIDEPPSP